MITFGPQDVYLVTGASSGIGKSTAQLLVRLGATVIAIGRKQERLEEAREQSENPQCFHPCACDLSENLDTLGQVITAQRERHGKFSGLVSSAGIMHMDGIRDYSREEMDKVLALHLHAPLYLAKHLSDRRNCVGPGTSLVFIGALGGVIPQTGLLGYGAAKAGLMLAAKNLSKELGRRKIRVNTISPALVRSPMTEENYSELMGYDVLASEEANYPLGLGLPEDVAHAAAFLLSPQARWISGQNLVLDGGRY